MILVCQLVHLDRTEMQTERAVSVLRIVNSALVLQSVIVESASQTFLKSCHSLVSLLGSVWLHVLQNPTSRSSMRITKNVCHATLPVKHAAVEQIISVGLASLV